MVGLAEVDDEPFMLSFRRAAELTDQGFDYLIDVKLEFRRPNDDGFPEPDEHHAAFQLRERLVVAAGDDAQLVGTKTGVGHRNHFLYAKETTWLEDWENSERSRTDRFAFETTVSTDFDWDTYRRLFRETERACSDVETLKKIEDSGANLDDPIDLDWYFYFPSAEKSRVASDSFTEHGYTMQLDHSFESGEWLVTASLHVRIDLRYIIHMSAMLDSVASEFGGRFDGWGVRL
jgi:hypothetical protein